MPRAPDTPATGIDFDDVEAPLVLCSDTGTVLGATAHALELMRRLEVVQEVPGWLPANLWHALDSAEPGQAVQWRPPGGSREVLGCTRYRAHGGYLLAMKEVSDMHAAQSRRFHRQRLEATGRLVASIAHELRNSVASIVYSADLLGMYGTDVPPEALAETIKETMAACRRLQATVDGLLDYARLGPTISVPVSLREVLNRARGFLRGVYREGSHEFRVELDPQAQWVKGNSLSIEQILVNLLLNAAEASVGPVSVHVSSERVPMPGTREPAVAIRVHDDGPGIPVHLRTQVFEPFFTTRDDGTGLGLNNAAEAAESLGGAIEILDVDDGACFVVYLPIGEPPP